MVRFGPPQKVEPTVFRDHRIARPQDPFFLGSGGITPPGENMIYNNTLEDMQYNNTGEDMEYN